CTGRSPGSSPRPAAPERKRNLEEAPFRARPQGSSCGGNRCHRACLFSPTPEGLLGPSYEKTGWTLLRPPGSVPPACNRSEGVCEPDRVLRHVLARRRRTVRHVVVAGGGAVVYLAVNREQIGARIDV